MSVSVDAATPRLYKIPELVRLAVGSDSTLRRWVREGRLPDRKNDQGQYEFTLEEIERAKFNRREPDRLADEDVRLWARCRAAEAPALTEAQVELVVGAFAEAMRGGVE